MTDYLSSIRKRLLFEHDPNDYGIWDVFGEDDNCDFAGPHSCPHLGRYEGKYKDIVEYALSLKRFISWGGGGRIEKYIPKKVIKIDDQSMKRKQELLNKKQELEKQLKEIEDELG